MSEEFDDDDNEFSYSFWVEQHRIMQEKRNELQRKLDIAVEALKASKKHLQKYSIYDAYKTIDEALKQLEA